MHSKRRRKIEKGAECKVKDEEVASLEKSFTNWRKILTLTALRQLKMYRTRKNLYQSVDASSNLLRDDWRVNHASWPDCKADEVTKRGEMHSQHWIGESA